MELKGKVLKIYQKKQISDKFALREFVVKTDEKYPQEVIIQVTQERCELLDNIIEGEELEVFINVRGRSWTNPQGEVKYFNSLEAWKINQESVEEFNSKESISKQEDKGGIENNFMEDSLSTLENDLPF